MPTTLFIGPEKPPNSTKNIQPLINPEDYISEILKQWPATDYSYHNNGYTALDWILKRNQADIGPACSLLLDKRFVTTGNAPYMTVVEFVIWHRKYMPIEIDLYLFDEGLRNIVNLYPQTTKASLLRIFWHLEL